MLLFNTAILRKTSAQELMKILVSFSILKNRKQEAATKGHKNSDSSL